MVGGLFPVGEEWAKFWPLEGGIPTIPPVGKTLDAATFFTVEMVNLQNQ